MAYEFKHVLVCVDFSEDSEVLLSTALRYFADKAESITVLSVADSARQAPKKTMAEIDELLIDKFKKNMQQFFKPFEGAHQNIRAIIRRGNPHLEILKTVEEIGVDLIAMGSQANSSPDRVFFGSTTYEVARKASCSVFVIRHPKK